MANNSKLHTIRKILLNIIQKLSALILAIIIALILFPILFILLSPIYIFRKIVSNLAKYIRPDLGKIVTTRSTDFSFDNLSTPACHTVIRHIAEGNFSVEEIKKCFTDRILLEKLPNGESRYLELKQYIVDWMGFKFWKNVEHFDISNHVVLYKGSSDNKPVTDRDLDKIRQDLLHEPYKRKEPLWKIVIVHNYIPSEDKTLRDVKKGPCSAMFFKVHHILADGYSMMKLIIEGICAQKMPEHATHKAVQRNPVKEILHNVTLPFKCFYEASIFLITRTSSRVSSPWYVSPTKRTRSVHALTARIPISTIKSIKEHFNVSFTSVILAACTGAMKMTLARKGIRVPKYSDCVLPFPLANHPQKLRNHMTQVDILLPSDPELNTEMRLKALNKSYENIKRSTAPVMNTFLFPAVGGLFTFLTDAIIKATVPPILISNFPSQFPHKLSIVGHEVFDSSFVCGLLDMPGLGFYINSYGGVVRIAVSADGALLSAEEIQEFANFIEKEFDLMESMASV